MSAFYQYFKENMDALHLPAPESLFGTAERAFDTVKAMVDAVKKFGAGATLREILLTIPGMSSAIADLAVLYPACKASYYVGACIGSAAVAAGRALAGGTQMSDFLVFADMIPYDHPVRMTLASEDAAASA